MCVGPIEVINVQRDNITIRWKEPEDDGGSPITGYIIEYREESSTNWNKAGKVNDFTLTYTVNYLTEKTMYHFRVIAVNKIGKAPPLETKDATLAKSPFGKCIGLNILNVNKESQLI